VPGPQGPAGQAGEIAVHIGLVGLGKMGGNMRQRLRKAGIEVTGFDFNPDISDVGSLEELVQALPTPRLVWVMVPAGGPTQATIDQLAGLLEADDLVIDGGNSKFTDDARHAEELGAKGIHFVDCGVSGGVWGLENGYGLMCGGDEADVEACRPLLGELGSKVLHVGPCGAGHALKALNNLLSASNLAAAAEVLTVARAFGIEADVMVDVINASTGRSQATEVKYPKHVLTGSYDSGFAMDLMIKDLRIARSLARAEGLQTPVTDAAAETADSARAALARDDLDHTEVARYYESVNGVSLRATRA
jgi:3-hydroxyisobutyrate dehydrogenase-like beta-hydroxyacid dehydrogenase